MDTLTYFEKITLQQADREFWLNVILATITFISVLLFYIDYKNRKDKERAEKSIKIAEQFANSLIPKLSIICNIFEKTKLENALNRVKFIQFENFDKDELEELYKKEEIDFYNKTISGTVTIDGKSISLATLIMETLNELEYISMYISTNVADEKYIYNSLHQQFFKAISLLYISISLINTDVKDKYFTNIIKVLDIWKKKYIKHEKKEMKFKKKLNPKMPKIK